MLKRVNSNLKLRHQNFLEVGLTLAHRSKSLNQIDSLDSRNSNQQLENSRTHYDSSPEYTPSNLSEINYVLDRHVVPSLCHASPSLVFSEDEDIEKHNLLSEVIPSPILSQDCFIIYIDVFNHQPQEIVVPSQIGLNLRDSIYNILERNDIDITEVDVFLESSNTPLPLYLDTKQLAGHRMIIKGKSRNETSTCSLSSDSINTKNNSQQHPFILPSSYPRQSAVRSNSHNNMPNKDVKTYKPISEHHRNRRGALFSYEDLVDDNYSISQDGTLKSGKRGPLSRKSGGIFSNPFKADHEKMDQLTELLNQYSHFGLSKYSGLEKIDTDNRNVFYLEDHWTCLVDNYEDMDKKLHNQQDAVWEMIQTELFYIQRLKVIFDLFLACLYNLQSECLLNDIDTNKMFSNIAEIYSANILFWNSCLLPMLNASRDNRQPLNPVLMKDSFLQFEDIFHPYLKYCLDHSNCLQYVKEKHKESELFKTYIAWCETRKDCQRLRLTDLLVKPMQRLTKYSLLLKAILKRTECEEQKLALNQMNDIVERFVGRVDSTLTRKHEKEKLAGIVNRIESYDAIESNNDEIEKIVREYCRLDLTCHIPGCSSQRIRQLLLEGSGLKFKDSYTSSKIDVHCFLFTDILLICKSIGRKGDKVKVIRQPFLVDRIVTHELKESIGFIVIYLNEFKVASAFFILYTNEIRTWIDHIKRAKENYKEAKAQNALLSAHSSIFRTIDSDDEDSDLSSSAFMLAQGSPKSSSSFLLYSTGDSNDITETSSLTGNVNLTKMHPSISNPSNKFTPSDTSELPSRATSFELGDLRNPSLTADSLELFRTSQSVDARAPVSVTLTSPRPERRAFLLRGSGAVDSTINTQYTNANTLSVNIPSFLVNKQLSPSFPNASIQVPSSSFQSSSIPKNANCFQANCYRLQRPLSISSTSSINKPPLIKMKNITGLKVHSAPTSLGHSPVLSFDSEQSIAESVAKIGGSDEQINYAKHIESVISEEVQDSSGKSKHRQKRSVRNERRYHTADSIENIKKEKDSSIHKRLSWNYGQQGLGKKAYHERIICNKHLGKCLSSETVYTSSGFSSTGSVPLSVNSCECEQCDIEMLDHIQELDLGSASSQDNRCPSSDKEESIKASDFKIDVSEVKEGISSVKITISDGAPSKPSKNDLRKMKNFLLTSLDASEV